jgi:hypothetical protein
MAEFGFARPRVSLPPRSVKGVRAYLMPTVDESIFGRIALANQYLRQDQLDECLRIQRQENPPRKIGEILREKGYLSEEQLKTIVEIRRKKARKTPRNSAEEKESDRSFGKLALSSCVVSIDDLEDAILEQQRLDGLNLHFRLGEILVSRARVSVTDVLEILRRQEKRILACPLCDTHYNVLHFQTGRMYRCLRCRGELREPVFLNTVAVEAVIESP